MFIEPGMRSPVLIQAGSYRRAGHVDPEGQATSQQTEPSGRIPAGDGATNMGMKGIDSL